MNTVSVVICCRPCDDVGDTIRSVITQTYKAHEIVVIMEDVPEGTHYPYVRFYKNEGNGLSGARNTGIKYTTGNIIAFIDSDAVAEKDWLENLIPMFVTCDLVGGEVIPKFVGNKRLDERLNWVIGCTDNGTTRAIGCNFAMRRTGILFDERFGKPHCIGEETHMIKRLLDKGYCAGFTSNAVVIHIIPDSRLTIRSILGRAYLEGKCKARIGISRVEMRYVSRYLSTLSPMIWAVLFITTVGYMRGKIN